jgi:CubicO group peptidase (beta-lactamase class C family)
MAGCQIKPIDFAKIGLVLLNKGNFNNEQVIANKYINEITCPCKQFEGYGMLWWLDYEQIISLVDDKIIDELITAGLPKDFIEKAKQMKGKYYSNNEYYSKVEAVFGENALQIMNETLGPKNLRLRKKEFGGTVIYRADGYLGNYIIVDPITKIVAIRMISHQSFQTEQDNFVDFKGLILGLTK